MSLIPGRSLMFMNALFCNVIDLTNKYASYPDWRNHHMPIAVTASGGQFVTQASRLPGQFVTPG